MEFMMNGFVGEILSTQMVEEKISGKEVKFTFSFNELEKKPDVRMDVDHILGLVRRGQAPKVPYSHSDLLWSESKGIHGVYIRYNEQFCKRILKKNEYLRLYFIKQTLDDYNKHMNKPEEVKLTGHAFDLETANNEVLLMYCQSKGIKVSPQNE